MLDNPVAPAGNTIRITKLLIHETGTYNQQYRRPYNTELTGPVLHAIEEKIRDSAVLVPSSLSGIANQFIAPTATPEKQIDMVNGWGERRLRFVMEVVCNHYTGGKVILMVLGYSSHMGVSIHGHIDPRMEFYVNSVMKMSECIMQTPMGNTPFTKVEDNSHVIVNNNWTSVYGSDIEQRLRPQDIYAAMTRTHLPDQGSGVFDARQTNSGIAVKSRRTNGIASNYVSKILDDYKSAATTIGFGQNEMQILESARGYSGESLASNDQFLMAISAIRGTPVGNVFTFQDLQMLDPNVDNVTVVQLMMPTQKVSVHQTGQTADWGASDRNTKVATIMSQSVPALLMDLGLTRIVFMATNRTMGSVITVTVLDVNGFTSGDQTMAVQAFEKRLEFEILRDISFENQTDFAVEMRVDLLGETWIRLALDGDPHGVDYVTPSFCDALTVPVLTTDNQLVTSIASDFETLTHSLLNACDRSPLSGLSAASTNHQQPFGRF